MVFFFCRDAVSYWEAGQHKIRSMLLNSTVANMYMISSCCHCLIGLPRRVKVYAEFGVDFCRQRFFLRSQYASRGAAATSTIGPTSSKTLDDDWRYQRHDALQCVSKCPTRQGVPNVFVRVHAGHRDKANTYEGSHCVHSPWKVSAEVGGKAAKYCANTIPYDCNEEARKRTSID